VQSSKSEFEKRGVSILIVSFAEPAKLLPYQFRQQWPFTILADPQRTAYHAFGLKQLPFWRVFSPSTLVRYLQLLREGRRPRRYEKTDIYQSGGDFILDRAGNVLFAHRGRNPADRPKMTQLLNVVDRAPRSVTSPDADQPVLP
jgi:AhpC/TSA antioxidant enzyme